MRLSNYKSDLNMNTVVDVLVEPLQSVKVMEVDECSSTRTLSLHK